MSLVCVYIYIYNLDTKVKGFPKAPFNSVLHQGVGEGATPFLELLHFALDT